MSATDVAEIHHPSRSVIGVVGLGAMGGQIAGRLLSQGNPVYGTNRTKAKADTLIDRGLRWRDTPRQVTETADVIISMVTDNDALQEVTDGPDGILAGLRPGKIYLDMSTISPADSGELARRVAARGAVMLTAPVSGSVPAVAAGTLAIMVGGDPDAYTRVEPILRQLGSTVTFVGDNEQALLLKLAINISLAVQMLTFSEGVLLAERGGIDRHLALDVLTGSAIGSPMLKTRAPLLLQPPGKAWFDVTLMQKDLRLALDTARDLAVPLPSTAVADEMLDTARAHGYQHRDISVLLQLLGDLTPAAASHHAFATT
jgi:3-hydroxyisobutyrate dehydrogenase-like beta-hydroxyacid dehydrogenase